MHSFVARHYLDGANYPTGTSRKIAETISDLIEKNGGSLYVNAHVKSIEVNKEKGKNFQTDIEKNKWASKNVELSESISLIVQELYKDEFVNNLSGGIL